MSHAGSSVIWNTSIPVLIAFPADAIWWTIRFIIPFPYACTENSILPVHRWRWNAAYAHNFIRIIRTCFAKCIQWKQAGINENRIRTSSDPQHLERHRTATILRNGRYGHWKQPKQSMPPNTPGMRRFLHRTSPSHADIADNRKSPRNPWIPDSVFTGIAFMSWRTWDHRRLIWHSPEAHQTDVETGLRNASRLSNLA